MVIVLVLGRLPVGASLPMLMFMLITPVISKFLALVRSELVPGRGLVLSAGVYTARDPCFVSNFSLFAS